MEMDDASLSTTIVSRTMSPLRVVCNFLTCRRMRRQMTPLGLTVPDVCVTHMAAQVPTIPCDDSFLESLRYVQDVHNISSMRSATNSLCRTKKVRNDKLAALVPKGMTLVKPMTCGGMSRIYTVRTNDGTHAVMKVSNLKTSLGSFEIFGYELLCKSGLQTPTIHAWDVKDGHLVIVTEQLECTVSTLVTAIAYHPMHRHLVGNIIAALKDLLARLHDASITFCDLSPDNIMCRRVDGGLQLVLIDPQFTLPRSCLSASLGEQWARVFDIVHFALKIQALSVLSHHPGMRSITREIVTALIGKELDMADIRKWLFHEIPVGLRAAYSSLKRMHRSNF